MKEKKKMSLFDLTSIGVGAIIGSGIFSMFGTGIFYAGRGLPIAMVLAMLVVFLEFIRTYILSATFELDGGVYDQAALTMPPILIGTGALLPVIGNLGLSIPGLAIGTYIVQLVPSLAPYERALAFLVVTLMFLISVRGNTFLSKIQNVMAVCMYAALFLFIIFGLMNYKGTVVSGTTFLPQGTNGFLVAVAMMSFTCSGVTVLPNYTKDAQTPKKRIPQAFILSTIVVAAFYALLGFAATVALPYEQIADKNLGYIAQQVMPTWLYIFFVVGGAIFALATTMLGGIGGFKWPILAAAQDGWLPAVFKKETKSGYPWVIMLFMYVVSVAPIVGGFSLENIVSAVVVSEAVIAIVGNIVNWNLPDKFPKAWSQNSLKMSKTGYHILMAISIIASLLLTYYTLSIQTLGINIANLAMTAFLFLYSIIRYRSGKIQLKSREVYRE